jgi:hypothetical protein
VTPPASVRSVDYAARGVPSFTFAALNARWYISAARACPAAKPSANAAPRRSKGSRLCAAKPARIRKRMAAEKLRGGCASAAMAFTATTRSAGRRTGAILAFGFVPRVPFWITVIKDKVGEGCAVSNSRGRIANSDTRLSRTDVLVTRRPTP